MALSPLVSVIVPVYKVEKYLRRCLDSLVRQTLQEIEIICVDDGSPDNCLNILKNYAAADPRIIIIRKDNGGLSSARNAGLEITSAPYIAFVDSDDWVSSELFEVAVSTMQIDPTIDFVHWGFFRYLEERDCIDNDYTLNPSRPYAGRCLLTDDIRRAANVMAWSKLYKAEIIKAHKLTFPEGLLYEDNAFWWMYNLHAKCGFFLNEPYYYYLIRPDSIMGATYNKQLKGNFDCILIAKLILDYYRQNDAFDQRLNLMQMLFAEIVLAGYKYTDNPEKYRSMILDAIEETGWRQRDLEKLIKRLNRPPDYQRPKYTLLEKMFSVKNFDSQKIIRLFGFHISIKRKRRATR